MGWPVEKLGDICRIELGKTPARSNKKYWDEAKASNNVWLSIADLPLSLKPIMVDSKEYISDEGAKLCKIVPKDTLVVSFKLSLGRLAVTGCDLYTNEAIAALYIHDDAKIEQDYLYWYLTFFDWDAAAGSDIKVKGKTLNKAKLKEIEIALPPIPEQKRIVAILDQAFADIDKARALTEQNLKNSRELFESYLQQVFSQRGEGYAESKMSDVCEITSKLVDPKESEYLDLPHIGAGNMISMTGELVDVKTAREEGLISGKFVFDSSMVLYSKIRPYLMKACRPEFVGLCSADVYPLRPKEGRIDKDYLFYLLLSKDFTDYAVSGSGRAGMPKVNRTHLFNYTFNLPSIDKQKSYVSCINQISRQVQIAENLYSEKLRKIDELKKSLLQKAYRGELTNNKQGAAA